MKNKFNILISFLLILVFAACGDKAGEDILPKKEMTDILVDISLLEGSFYATGIPRVQQRKRDAYYESVFERHSTTAEQFDNSLDWYARKPKELEGIYKDANAVLKEMESEAEEKKKQEDEKRKEEKKLTKEVPEQEKQLQQE